MALSILVFERNIGPRAIRFRLHVLGSLLVIIASLAMVVPHRASAQERAWVRGEVRLNLRSGAGTQYRILGVVTTGDGLAVLERVESWTKVRTADALEGWIPEGYLEPNPPPTVRLAQLEAEVSTLRDRLSTTTEESGKLRTSNESLSTADERQRSEIERLVLDNTKLRAGARYPELIAGASILAAGMILGAMLHRSSSNRRPSSRIRL